MLDIFLKYRMYRDAFCVLAVIILAIISIIIDWRNRK